MSCSVLVLSLQLTLSRIILFASDSSSCRGITATVFIHAAIFLVPAVAIALSKPAAHGWEPEIFLGLTLMANLVIAPFFVVLQFYPRYLEIRRSGGDPGSLSLLSLGSQALVIFAVGLRCCCAWKNRLGEICLLRFECGMNRVSFALISSPIRLEMLSC